MRKTVCAVICAAGTSTRTGFAQNKLLVPFMGATALEKSISAFDFSAIDEIIVTANENDFAQISTLCEKFTRTRVVRGGTSRMQSVYNALQTVQSDIVLIHDGARPFVTRTIIENCLQSVLEFGSGICAVDCVDTIAQIDDNKIIAVPDRKQLKQIQTPQGFFTEHIRSAYESAIQANKIDFTDDSSIFAAFCSTPRVCAGARENIKLTYAEDFTPAYRCGMGIDTHAFGKNQNYIVLAGVRIPAQSGLVAHSDGDVLVHALMDALLSACGLNDIGHYFPDTDEKWKDANSMQMLAFVLDMVWANGYKVQNVSLAILAETPHLAPYIDEMKTTLANALKIDQTRVGITAGTNEKLGYIGEGKGITVHAYALLSHTR